MNVLIINGHPRNESFSEALVNAYIEGAPSAGATVCYLKLADLSFNPNVIVHSPRYQHFEGDIVKAQKLIATADHLVFVYPTWWGTMPALLKAFIDRVFTPGFAFEEIEGGTGYAPLLNGRSAQLITTMDTPKWVYRLIYRSPGHNAMRRAILEFCGIAPVNILSFAAVKDSTLPQRRKWIDMVKQRGHKLRQGAVSPYNAFKLKIGHWLKAIRLQFYPMTLLAYLTGAYAAQYMNYGYDRGVCWAGYAWIFFLEVATVLSNDYFDFRSDEQNKFFSPFTGGSRVIVNKLLSFQQIKKGILVSLTFSCVALAGMLVMIGHSISSSAVLLACGVSIVLALGYTVPPLRFSYRSLGEVDVAFTHSFGVMLCGYVFQGGSLSDTFPWVLSLPLFLGVLPSIILAGVPDYEADKAAGKSTIAVRFGKRMAASIAILFTILSAGAVIVLKESNLLVSAFGNVIYLVIPHAALLVTLLYKFISKPMLPHRVDTIMVAALTYILWFVIIPFIKLG